MRRGTKPRLTEEDIRIIVALIEAWAGVLTWDLLVQRVERILGRSYSRQALDGHDAIKASYQARKRRDRAVRDGLKAGRNAIYDMPPELAMARQRIEAADVRIKALEQQLERYKQQFVVWLYNARNAGVTVEKLNAPLPATSQEHGALWSSRRKRR